MLDRGMRKCLKACLGWGICQAAGVVGMSKSAITCVVIPSAPPDLDEHVCWLVGQAKGSELHPDIPVLVANNEDEFPCLPLLQWIY